MNVESMLEPVSPGALCGEDVTFDDLMAGGIEPLLEPGFEYQAPDDPSPPRRKPIDWKEVRRLSLQLFEKGKHLRLAVLLTESGMELEGIAGLRDGLALVEGLCTRYWDEVYPNEMPYMLQERAILLNGLADARFVKRVAKVPLAVSRVAGAFSWDDFETARKSARESEEAANAMRLITGVFTGETSQETHRDTLDSLNSILRSIDEIDRVCRERLTGGNEVNFSGLRQQVTRMAEFIQPFAEPQSAPQDETAAGDGLLPAGESSGPPGAVHSRESAIAAMDRIIEYFERHEPSSPVPFLLRRAQRCVGLNFLDLVDDLAQARSSFETLLIGTPRQE